MNITERYSSRIAASYARIEDVCRHRDSGVYVAEMEYDKVTSTPWMFGQ